MSVNRVAISGNLTRDPELRSTQSGMHILNFGIAVNDRRRNNATGEWEDYANFIDCVLFGNRAEWLARDLHKGKKVFDGGIAELKHNFGDVRTLEFELVNAPDFKLLDYHRRFHLTEDELSAERDGSLARVRFDTAEVSVEDVVSYTLSTVHVKDLNIKGVEIEEIIKRLYRREVSL